MTEKRLRPKYLVQKYREEDGQLSGPRMKSTDPDDVDSPFVLMPRKDPAAYYALLHYTEVCEPDLSFEIRQWLEKVVRAPAKFGSQGDRNRIEMKLKQMRLFS